MRIFVLRLALTLLVLFLLYQETAIARVMVIFTFGLGYVLSYIGLYRSVRERILSLLADKILFASTLVVFADLRVLSSAVVAWVIGGLFIYSGIDLLQGSLRASSPLQSKGGDKGMSFRATWMNHLVQMGLVFTLLILISFREDVSRGVYAKILTIISYAWVILTAFLITQCLLSKRFKELVKEA